jgi:hypothetical protein
VRGSVIGISWVGATENFAPITGAKVAFVNAAGDTFASVSDATYGDYSVSLPSGNYTLTSLASGFAPRPVPQRLDSVKGGASVHFNDTLTAFGIVFGSVQRSDISGNEGNVLVSLVDTITGATVVSGKSQSNGSFEIHGVPDGGYRVGAGKDSLVLDAVLPGPVLTVSHGKVSVAHVSITMFAGSKKIAFVVDGGADSTSAIKVRSPLQKTISVRDTLYNMGKGDYVITVAAIDPRVIDLASHRFHVDSTGTPHIERISLLAHHTPADSVSTQAGKIALVMSADSAMDSVRLFFRDINTPSFLTAMPDSTSGLRSYFNVAPPKDGSNLVYYFVGYRGTDVYGYDQEPFFTYVKPDTARLTKFEIIPGNTDTLLFPAHYKLTFTFAGYVSSTFLPARNVAADALTWSLVDPQGCVLQGSPATSVTVTTAGATSGLVRLALAIDTSRVKLASHVSRFDTLSFGVSSRSIDSIIVFRVDPDNPSAITTSAQSRAEFTAMGIDRQGGAVSMTPIWHVDPATAGQISAAGVFVPAHTFVGYARIFASSSDGKIKGEYSLDLGSQNNDKPWLKVDHVVVASNAFDTASNGVGCTVIFPPKCVEGSDQALLEVREPSMANGIVRGGGTIHVIGQAFDIQEMKNVQMSFATGTDSVRLIIDVPKDLQSQVKTHKGNYKIGLWNADRLEWDSLSNSVVASSGMSVSAALAHFSRYALLSTGGSLGVIKFSITPNPFSPYVKPTAEFLDQPGVQVRRGACVEFTLDSDKPKLESVQFRVFSMMGELVYSVIFRSPNATQNYRLWWDGKTTNGEKSWDGNESTAIETSKMCRNGRYFAVLSVTDLGGKQIDSRLPVVLLK